MTHPALEKPSADEHAPYYQKYIDLVPPGDVTGILATQIEGTLATLRGVSDEDSLRSYGEGKWSLREVAGHIMDAERVFAYRALRIGRGDATPLPGFDQDPYIATGRFNDRSWNNLLGELEAVRRSTLFLVGGFDEAAWTRRGVASENPVSVRGLIHIIAGHEMHHMKIVRERYLS